jgi:hypothetical protein
MTFMRLVWAAVATIVVTLAIMRIGVEPLFALGYGLLAGATVLLTLLRGAGSDRVDEILGPGVWERLSTRKASAADIDRAFAATDPDKQESS